MELNIHRNHKEVMEGGVGGGKGGGGGSGGRRGTYRYTVTIGMIPAVRWAAMRAILIFH